ncbi:Uncharacterised protein [Mycobacteroides abscessus subsp. abscessus]|nr:Uncharacterised protein [Mycobacteroides abscessus subsp. abscessus]
MVPVRNVRPCDDSTDSTPLEYETRVRSAVRTSRAFASSRGSTATTVSARSLATTCRVPRAISTLAVMGCGVSNTAGTVMFFSYLSSGSL